MDRKRVNEANEQCVQKMMEANPVLVDIRPAIEVIPGMTAKTILHSGPPIEWARMCKPVKSAVAGALILEGLAKTEDEALELAQSGEITFDACHNHAAVGPMAGVTSASMPVYVVKNTVHGNVSYSCLNEGRGKVLRYGGTGKEVQDRLNWMGRVFGPALGRALRKTGGIAIKPILAEALHMGDDCHDRYKAASLLFLTRVLETVLSLDLNSEDLLRVAKFLAENDYTFLNIHMACGKAMADAAHGVEHSTVVTAMTRNGTDFGIRVSGLDGWFVAASPKVDDGLYYPGYGPEDATPDMGDSTITETTGFGAFAAAASPIIVTFVGNTFEELVRRNVEMYDICVAENPEFTIPYLDFRGVPAGVCMLKVLETNILPFLFTGIAHKEGGIGMIGAGQLRAPSDCFKLALKAYAAKYGS